VKTIYSLSFEIFGYIFRYKKLASPFVLLINCRLALKDMFNICNSAISLS
jgi:hypothetical protein